MGRVGVEILLTARGDLAAFDAARQRVQAVRAEIGGLVDIVKGGALLGVGAQLASALTAIPQAMSGAIRQGVAFNAQIESGAVSFQTLLGSASAAQVRMQDLYTFAARTPFQLGEIVRASTLLQAFSGNVLSSGDGLRLMGDAAAAVSANIQEVARWVGRLYAGLRAGAPLGEPIQRLTEMGLISNATRADLQKLSGTVLSQSQAFDVLQRNFGQFNGAMQRQSTTFNGVVSTLKDAWSAFLGQATQPIFDVLRTQLGTVTEALSDPKLIASMRTFLRPLADLLKITLENVPALLKLVQVTGYLAAAFAVFKIGQFARGMIEYGLSLVSATASEARQLAAIEAKLLAQQAQAAQLQRIIALQAQLNALQTAGAVNAARSGTISLGLAGAELQTAARGAAIRNLNETLAKTPGLMGNVGTAAGTLARALPVIGLAVTVGIFGINYWKNWRIDAIEAMDAVRAASALRAKDIRGDVLKVRTEEDRQAALEKAQEELTAARIGAARPGGKSGFDQTDVQQLERLVKFIESNSAEQIKGVAISIGRAPDITAAQTAAQAEREAIAKEAREATDKAIKDFEAQMKEVQATADQSIVRAQLENAKLKAQAAGDRKQVDVIDIHLEAVRLAEELRVNDPLLSPAQRAAARQALDERVELKRRELEVQRQLSALHVDEVPAADRLAQIAADRARIEQTLTLDLSTRQIRLQENTTAYREQIAVVVALKEGELSITTDLERRAAIEREILRLKQQGAEFGGTTAPPTKFQQAQNAFQQSRSPEGSFQGIGQGAQAGALGFLTQIGTEADAVANDVENSLNEALRGSQDLVYNLATGATTFREAWNQATAFVGQQLFRMLTDSVTRMIWRATVERTLVAAGVVTHVAGETTKTSATLAGGALRIAMTIKEALASVYHGAIEAFKSMAAWPYVGPILGAAAMAAAIAAGIGLIGKIGHADGAIIRGPGGPRDDRVPAMLSNGEAVTRAAVVSKFGEEFFMKLNAGVLDLSAIRGGVTRADGGFAIPSADYLNEITIPDRVSPGLSQRNISNPSFGVDRQSDPVQQEPPKVHIGIFDNRADVRKFFASSEGQAMMFDTVRGALRQVG